MAGRSLVQHLGSQKEMGPGEGCVFPRGSSTVSGQLGPEPRPHLCPLPPTKKSSSCRMLRPTAQHIDLKSGTLGPQSELREGGTPRAAELWLP